MKSEIEYLNLIDKVTNKENILAKLVKTGQAIKNLAIRKDGIEFSRIYNKLTNERAEQLKYKVLVYINNDLNKLINERYLANGGFTLSKSNIAMLLFDAMRAFGMSLNTKLNFIEILPSDFEKLKTKFEILDSQVVWSHNFNELLLEKNSEEQVNVYSTEEFICDRPLLFDLRALDRDFEQKGDEITIFKDTKYDISDYEDNIGTLRCKVNGIEKEIGLEELIEINQKNYDILTEKLKKQLKTFEDTFSLDEIKIAFLMGATGIITKQQLEQRNSDKFIEDTYNKLISKENKEETIKKLIELDWFKQVTSIMPYVIRARLDKDKQVAVRIVSSTLTGKPGAKEKLERYYKYNRENREEISASMTLGKLEQKETKEYKLLFKEGTIEVEPKHWLALGIDSYNEEELIPSEIIYAALVEILKSFKDDNIAIIVGDYSIGSMEKLKKIINGLKFDRSKEFNISSTADCK